VAVDSHRRKLPAEVYSKPPEAGDNPAADKQEELAEEVGAPDKPEEWAEEPAVPDKPAAEQPAAEYLQVELYMLKRPLFLYSGAQLPHHNWRKIVHLPPEALHILYKNYSLHSCYTSPN
jgi:hypothetical protein